MAGDDDGGDALDYLALLEDENLTAPASAAPQVAHQAVVAPLSTPPSATPPPDVGFFAAPLPVSDAPVEPPPLPGRAALAASGGPPTVVAKRVAKSNRLGVPALVFGVIGLSVALFIPTESYTPFVMYPVGVNALLAVAGGFLSFRHAVNTGAPGLRVGLAAVVVGVAALITMFVKFNMAADERVSNVNNPFTTFALMDETIQMSTVPFGGEGTATVTLDGQPIDVPLVNCGFHDPVDGFALGAFGDNLLDVSTQVVLLRRSIGGTDDIVRVTFVGNDYFANGEGLITLAGNVATYEGELRSVLGPNTVQASIVATCSH